jgi:hypothetical protein
MEGGDKMVAVYCILKSTKGQRPKFTAYKSRNKVFISGYSLLKKETGLTLANLKKFVPVFVRIGLVSFEANGDVTMLGNEACKDLFNSYKLVPVNVVKSIYKTAYRSMAVRAHSKERMQKREIQRKSLISVLQKQIENPTSATELAKAKKQLNMLGGNENFKSEVILSNVGFAKLKVSERGELVNKQKGHYWKKKLAENGLIQTKRRYEEIRVMEYSEFEMLKNNRLIENRYVYKNGCLMREIASTFMVKK